MKVIIPLAGKGTRLRPHTHITPKPMLKIAGKPVIDYVMDDLQRLGNVEQVIYITGHLKDKVEEYARAEMDVPSVFIEQKVQDGTAGAIALARDCLQPALCIELVLLAFLQGRNAGVARVFLEIPLIDDVANHDDFGGIGPGSAGAGWYVERNVAAIGGACTQQQYR